jgi:hypothetical protein
MAKVIGPLHSTEARGRVDSLVYNTWRGIRYVRSYIAPVFKSPDCRIAQKARVAAAIAAWKLLTDAGRAAWHDYAELHSQLDWTGVPLRWTGANWFVSCYTRILRVAGTAPTSPPHGYPPLPLATWTISLIGSYAHLVWTYPTQPEAHTYYLQILKQKLTSLGRQPDFHHASILTHEGLATSPYDDLLYAWGKYAFWARVLDAVTGLMTPMLLGTIILPATPGLGQVIGRCWDGAAGIEGVVVGLNAEGAITDHLGIFVFNDITPGDYTVTPDEIMGPWIPPTKPAHVTAGVTTDVGDFLLPPS